MAYAYLALCKQPLEGAIARRTTLAFYAHHVDICMTTEDVCKAFSNGNMLSHVIAHIGMRQQLQDQSSLLTGASLVVLVKEHKVGHRKEEGKETRCHKNN